jgi:hypothetical protein
MLSQHKYNNKNLVPVYTVKKYAAVLNQNLYIGEYSGISSLKLKTSGI